MDQSTINLIIALASFFVGMLTLLWRIQVMMNKQVGGLRKEMHDGHAQLRGEQSELRGELHDGLARLRGELHNGLTQLRGELSELRSGQAALSNRLSRLEGMLVPKPWDPPGGAREFSVPTQPAKAND